MLTMVQSVLPYQPLSEERKSELEAILRSSNSLLKEYHEKIGGMRRAELLAEIIRGRRLFKGVVVSEKDANHILRTKKVEMEVLCGFSRMIDKVAKKWAISCEMSSEDVSSESIAAALLAVVHYNKETKFSTFLVSCVRNHLSRVFNESSGVSYDSLKLKWEYDVLKRREGATFDEVVGEMKITERQAENLRFALVSVKNEASLGEDEVFQPADKTEMPSDEAESVRKIIGSLKLSRLERAMLDAVMHSPLGKLELSKTRKNLVNPDLNKPYSRAALSAAWLTVKKKISDALLRAS